MTDCQINEDLCHTSTGCYLLLYIIYQFKNCTSHTLKIIYVLGVFYNSLIFFFCQTWNSLLVMSVQCLITMRGLPLDRKRCSMESHLDTTCIFTCSWAVSDAGKRRQGRAGIIMRFLLGCRGQPTLRLSHGLRSRMSPGLTTLELHLKHGWDAPANANSSSSCWLLHWLAQEHNSWTLTCRRSEGL